MGAFFLGPITGPIFWGILLWIFRGFGGWE